MTGIFSLSDENPVVVKIVNLSKINLSVTIKEELPSQFQERNFNHTLKLKSETSGKIAYSLRPLSRGEYHFGNTIIYLKSVLGLIERRIVFNHSIVVPVYPSVIQMMKTELRAFPKISQLQGVRKLRRLGHSYEFDQIKNYVSGDDYRSINWKATGKKASIMVNQYEDERAQQVYFVIDKSRNMRLPFNGLSLLDYAINTTLSMANITIKKRDKAGLITFSKTIDTFIRADWNSSQLRHINNRLYKEKENKEESNYELLYAAIRNSITARSLIVLFTNFESLYSMERILPILRKLNRQHLLLVVFFKNSELTEFAAGESSDIQEIYLRTIADKFIDEKAQIIVQLRLYGIQALQTEPENLTVDVVNKYLELKSRGMI